MSTTVSDKVSNFFRNYPLRIFEQREILIRPDEPLPGVFYLVEGLVSQYDVTPQGSEVVVNVFKPGAFFPMSTALNHTSVRYFFEASSKIQARCAPAADVVEFLHDNPDVTMDLLQRVYRGVDGVLRRMTHLMGGDAQHRLLFEILNAAYRFGQAQPDGSLRIMLNEGDLAKQSGLARETINRNMQALKTADVIAIDRKGILIKDLEKLEKLLGDTV